MITIDGKQIKLQIWDTVSHEEEGAFYVNMPLKCGIVLY